MKRLVFALCAVSSTAVFAANEAETVANAGPQSASPISMAPVSRYTLPANAIYDNGPLVSSDGVGTGVGGADESILQGDLTPAMTTLGAGHQVSAGNRVADDFTVTQNGWQIDQVHFFAYQTNATASTITAVNLQIWDGVPGAAGSNVVWGDTTTNVMTATAFSGILRVTNTTTGTSNARQIAVSTVDVGVTLAPGTYWFDWQSDGSAASGPWAPPITIKGQNTTGNAMQYTSAWAALNDGGSNTPQGLPFVILGSINAAAPEVVPSMNQWGIMALLLLVGFVSYRFIGRKA